MSKTTTHITNNNHNLQNQKILFPALMWLLSRLIILIVMFLIMPIAAKTSNIVINKYGWWDVLFAWDSVWYYNIATTGYNYGLDFTKTQYSVAFFPLYPLSIWILTKIGIPIVVAGLLINNLAFFAALIVLYSWVEERYGQNSARWATAIMAWCPYSIYGTVMYTEGLFFLFSISALRAFDQKQYGWAGFWGALSSATRITGITLLPAFFLTAWKQKRPIKAYITSFAVASGVAIYSLYCLWKFGDALAFLNAQKGWRTSAGFAWQGWWYMLMQIAIGGKNAAVGYIKDPFYLLQFAIIVVSAILLLRFRQKLGLDKVRYGFFLLWFVLWLMTRQEITSDPFSSEPLIKIVIIFGGLYLLCYYCQQIPLVAAIYGFFSYGIALNTGLTASVERYVYAIAPLFIASGFLFAKYPRWGYAVIAFGGLILVLSCIRFAQDLWLA
jgi:Gpi18-like mannosyltransferase